MSILIEYGTYSDLDAIETLYNDVTDALETGINYPGWKKGIYPAREDAMKGIDSNTLFVARNDNVIVGSIILNHEAEAGYDRVKWQYTGNDGNILIVHTLAVHPNFLKSGIGRQLLNFAERFGRQNNIASIRLDVYERNTPAIKLYESCGYQYMSTVDLGLGSFGIELFRLYEKLL